MPGVTLYPDIAGSLDAKNIVLGVLTKGVQLSNLASAIGTTVQVPKLDANIPILTAGAVKEDVEEMETSDIEGGSFTYVNFHLKKDRVKLMVSDEAQYRSNAGDPLELQKAGAGAELAAILDKKIVAALQTSPQTNTSLGAWSTVTNSPLMDLGRAVAAILPYKADFVVMPSHVWAHYISNDFVKNIGVGNPATLKGAMATVPGLDLNIFINDNVTADSVLVGSSTGLSAVLGNGPVKVRTQDSVDGGTLYQMDVFRQVKAPIFKTDANLNKSVYQTTAVTA